MLTNEQRLAMLAPPSGLVDVVIDTDAYNEIDDQFAIAYAFRRKDRISVKALYAAPFLNQHSTSPADGMEKSYFEIQYLLDLLEDDCPVFRGSENYLSSEFAPVISPAAEDLCRRAMDYSPEHPLYVACLGAITNVASALLMEPQIAERIVVIWLGGHGFGWMDNNEFNLRQDIAAARIIYGSGVPLVMLPCQTVVSPFATTGPELDHWLRGRNALCDYLVQHTVDEVNTYAEGQAWSRTIWDVTAIAWLVNDEKNFLWSKLIPTPLPGYDLQWEHPEGTPLCRYVFHVYRDNLFTDLFTALAQVEKVH